LQLLGGRPGADYFPGQSNARFEIIDFAADKECASAIQNNGVSPCSLNLT
jgi:hypothetical protein